MLGSRCISAPMLPLSVVEQNRLYTCKIFFTPTLFSFLLLSANRNQMLLTYLFPNPFLLTSYQLKTSASQIRNYWLCE